MVNFLTPFVIVIFLQLSSALDFRGIEETYSCDKFTVDPKLDPSWMETVHFWYAPFWSKLDLYQNARDFFDAEEFANLTAADVDKTCAYYQMNTTNAVIHGFNGRILNYQAYPDPIRQGVSHYGTYGKTNEYIATAYITLTDNKSYFFAVTQWSNGYKGFNVGSTVPKLDEKALKEIKQHATDLGFDPKHFEATNYDKCSPPPSVFLKSTN